MEGFDLEYHGPRQRQDSSRNLPFHVGDEQVLWDKVMKEVQLNNYAGPFEEKYTLQKLYSITHRTSAKSRK